MSEQSTPANVAVKPAIIPLPSIRAKNIAGVRFDRLLAIGYVGNRKGCALWLCECDCGREIVVLCNSLTRGNTKSCGCLSREKSAAIARIIGSKNKRHGLHNTPEYRAWASMKERCENPKCRNYANYGGRGISVCQRWRDSFEAFHEDVGDRLSPKHTIERINNAHGYEPGNCRWATMDEQANNKRTNRLIECDGVTRTVADWSRTTGLSTACIRGRLDAGWPIRLALSSPSGAFNRWRKRPYTEG